MINMVTDLAFIRRVLQAILEEKTDVTCSSKEAGPVTMTWVVTPSWWATMRL